MQAPAALQKLAIGCLVIQLSKLAYNLFDGFLKGANIMQNI